MTGDDRAWVVVDTTLPPKALVAFCADVERLLRLNPCLEFSLWQWRGPQDAMIEGNNRANGTAFAATLQRRPLADGMVVEWSGLLKTRTTFTVEELPTGSRLVVTDDYSNRSESECAARLAEVDTSLLAWGRELHRFLAAWSRWSRWPGWRWWMERVWLPMRPSTRRIARMLLWVTAAEFAALMVLLTVLRLEG